MKKRSGGYLVISLDFELFWGMVDTHTLKTYGENILGVRQAIPQILELFAKHEIHATWATLGMLMTQCKRELLSTMPQEEFRPTYPRHAMSSYHHIETGAVGENESDDPYHYGPSLVREILRTPHQELGNHTFSHYYAIDGYKNGPEVLRADLRAHKTITSTYKTTTESIVFPRNQASDDALRVCQEEGIRAYRGNEDHFLYRPRKHGKHSYIIRALRLIDTYLNISGHHTYPLPTIRFGYPLNIPASRFFRPYMKSLALFESLRIHRIKTSMTHSAKRGEVFHLWWHPHNFGANQKENFKNLEKIITHFEKLKKEYGMESASMHDITEQVCGV